MADQKTPSATDVPCGTVLSSTADGSCGTVFMNMDDPVPKSDPFVYDSGNVWTEMYAKQKRRVQERITKETPKTIEQVSDFWEAYCQATQDNGVGPGATVSRPLREEAVLNIYRTKRDDGTVVYVVPLPEDRGRQ